jgi:cytolysin (calcineurin-like family phosphatase)
VKSNPHASQNRPDRAPPHCGQGSPVTFRADPAEAGPDADGAGEAAWVAAAEGAALMRIPQTSQKSVAALS